MFTADRARGDAGMAPSESGSAVLNGAARGHAQVAAWKEMEPKVRATGYRMDSRAEVLYSSLDVRDALDKTRSLQERARTARRAVETHVEHCAAAVEKALANPVAIHRASP